MEKQTAASLDVSQIMEEIRAEIKEKGYNSEMLSFADIPAEPDASYDADRFDTDILRGNVQYLCANYAIAPEQPLSGNPLRVLWRRLVRRMVRFYLEPYAQAQNDWNANAAQAGQQLERFVQESRMYSTKALAERIEVLELQQKNAKLLIEQQQAQIAQLQRRLAALEGES